MKFDDFIFSDRLFSNLTKLLSDEGRIPNVLCFYGQPGTGKTSFAEFIASKLCSCTQYQDIGMCNLDSAYFKKLNIWCSTLAIDSLDQHFPFKKGVILDEFHDLTPNKQDKFKTLLEKHRDCLFIICLNTTPSIGIKEMLTPAIRSRVHVVDFNLYIADIDAVASKVEEKFPQLAYQDIVSYLPDMRRVTREAALIA